MAYAHYCEVMPDVHRGRLIAERIKGGFRLKHPSREFARGEALDIVVNELALGDMASVPPRLPSEEMIDLARTAPAFDEAALAAHVASAAADYSIRIREDAVVGLAAIRTMLGIDDGRFRSI